MLSPEAGIAPGAPILHEKLADYIKVFDAGSSGNVASRTRFEEGDVDAAWADCDVIVEGEFDHPGPGPCRHRALRRPGRDRAPAAA